MTNTMGEVGQQISVGAVYHMHYKDKDGRDCVEEVDLGAIADDTLSPRQIERRLKKVYRKHPRFAQMQRELARELSSQENVGG